MRTVVSAGAPSAASATASGSPPGSLAIRAANAAGQPNSSASAASKRRQSLSRAQRSEPRRDARGHRRMGGGIAPAERRALRRSDNPQPLRRARLEEQRALFDCRRRALEQRVDEAPVGGVLLRAARQHGKLRCVDRRCEVARQRQRGVGVPARNQRVDQRGVEIGALRHRARRRRGFAARRCAQTRARQRDGVRKRNQRRFAAERFQRRKRVARRRVRREAAREGRARRFVAALNAWIAASIVALRSGAGAALARDSRRRCAARAGGRLGARHRPARRETAVRPAKDHKPRGAFPSAARTDLKLEASR